MKHIANEKGITYRKYLKNYKNKTQKYKKKGIKKNRLVIPKKSLTPIPEIRKRCPNGSRRNKKTELCVKKGLSKRCPNGTRRNKRSGICERKKVVV